MEEKRNGTIKISEEVIANIAITAATEIDGVEKVNQKISTTAKSLGAHLKHVVKGVNILNGEGGMEITLQVVVKHGCNIPDVAQKVQKNVSEALSSMTGISVKHVNVIVAGVCEENKQ